MTQKLKNKIFNMRMASKKPKDISDELGLEPKAVTNEIFRMRKRGQIFPMIRNRNKPIKIKIKRKFMMGVGFAYAESHKIESFSESKQNPTTDRTYKLKQKGSKFHTNKSLDYIFAN